MFPVLCVSGEGHSVLVLGHVQSHSGYVSGVGHSVLLTSVLGHVQSHSRGGHVVCSSASMGTVVHCVTIGHVASSGRLSVDKNDFCFIVPCKHAISNADHGGRGNTLC